MHPCGSFLFCAGFETFINGIFCVVAFSVHAAYLDDAGFCPYLKNMSKDVVICAGNMVATKFLC